MSQANGVCLVWVLGAVLAVEEMGWILCTNDPERGKSDFFKAVLRESGSKGGLAQKMTLKMPPVPMDPWWCLARGLVMPCVWFGARAWSSAPPGSDVGALGRAGGGG